MNKTISITLNGMIFHIEEDGYEKLNNYLDSIKQHFSEVEGRDEIIGDIESNIADKFSSKISSKKKVITTKDVKEIIEIMGSVQDIAEEAENTSSEEGGSQEVAKRLYRDPDNAVLAGVCSGLGAYFNIDPVIFRVLFVISFLFYGTSVLAYIVLWIAMPKAETNAQKLEMKGDSVTLKKIEENFKNKVADPETKAKLRSAPLNIINGLFEVFGNFAKKVWPALVVTAGIFIIVINVFVLGVATFLLGVFFFDINSAYINSEISWGEILTSSQYYTGLISFYVILLIPAIIFLLIGLSLAKRKNIFTTLSTGALVGVWMIALLIFSLVAVEVAPRIGESVDRSMNEKGITLTKDLKDFNRISIEDNNRVTVNKADDFSVSLTGRESDLEGLDLNVANGELSISKDRENGICIFCYDRPVKIDITMPSLKYLNAGSASDAKIVGFNNEKIKIIADRVADVEAELYNAYQDIKIAGNADLELTGTSTDLMLTMDGFGDLNANDIISKNAKIFLDDHAEAHMSGLTDILNADLRRHSDLFAFEMKANKVNVNMMGNGTAQVNASSTLESVVGDGQVYYKGDPEIKTPKEILDQNDAEPEKPIKY
ncbi:MAG: GIN domain-containing protein [Patescibacteria group bacterium]